MKKKIEKNEYIYLDQFENDVALICNNATTYNPSNTIWYKDAKALFVKWKKLARQAQSHLDPAIMKTPVPTRPKTRNTMSTPNSASQLSPPSMGTPSSPGPAIPSTPLTSKKRDTTPMSSRQEQKTTVPSPSVVAAAVQRSAVQSPSVLATAYSPVVPKQGDANSQKPSPYSSYISNYLMWQRNPNQLSVPQSGMISSSANNALKNIYVVPDAQYIGGLESFVEKMGPRAIESVQLYLSHLRDPSLKMVVSSPPLAPDRSTKPQLQVSNGILEDLKAVTAQPLTETQLLELSSLQTQGYDVSFLGTLAPQLRLQLIDVPRSSVEVQIDKLNTQEILDQNTQNLIMLQTLQAERLSTSKEKNKPMPKEEAMAMNVARSIAELGALVPPDYLTSYKELLTGS